MTLSANGNIFVHTYSHGVHVNAHAQNEISAGPGSLVKCWDISEAIFKTL